MNAEIIALQCPSCGSSETVASRAAHFGHEFKCKHCKTTSVLIINSKLHIRAAGEHVCAACGRVASAMARFCQCGSSLIQRCRRCDAEFAVDHMICDKCGWPTGIDPESAEGHELTEKKAIQLLSSNNGKDIDLAFLLLSDDKIPISSIGADAIMNFLRKGKFSHPSYWSMKCLPKMGTCGIALLAEFTRSEQSKIAEDAVRILAEADSEAGALVLLDAFSRMFRAGQPLSMSVYYVRKCGLPAVPFLIEILEYGEQSDAERAGKALVSIGRSALPALKKHTGFFTTGTLSDRARRVVAVINGEKDLSDL